MNIRLGIYEIFSRIVPGAVYMAAIAQLLSILGLMIFDWQALNNVSLIASLGLALAAYVVGAALNPFSFLWLYTVKRKGVSHESLTVFKEKYGDDWEFDFEDKHWPVLLAFIRTKDLELASDIERQNAISIMMRNVSLGLAWMMVNFVFAYLLFHNPLDLLAALFLLVVSVLSLRESTKFRRWFYDAVFETTLAYRLDLEKIIKPVHHAKPKKNAEKQDQETGT